MIAPERAGREVSAVWLEQRTGEVLEAVTAVSASEISDLLDLARSPRELGAAIAGLPAFCGRPSGWLNDELPVLPIPAVRWVIPGRPAGQRRRRGRGRTDDVRNVLAGTLTAAVASFTERARAACRDAAIVWAGLLRDQAERLADAEAARFRTYLATLPREQHFAMLAGLADRLADFRDSLNARVPASITRERQAEPAPNSHDGRCEICGQMETTLTEYLIRCQLLLATSEAGQARHAKTGGFCTLHTWQYAHMASPVGISAGNAALADALAEALQDIRRDSASNEETARAVGGLAQRGTCGACAVPADRQQRAAAQLAKEALPAAPPTVCLGHLALVLDAGPSPEVGRA